MSTIAEVFDQALHLHQEGNREQAEPLYRAVLRADPDHADAHHLLGVLVHQTGRHEEAFALIERAIALEPTVAEYHFNLGTIYANRGFQDKAIACFHGALKNKPQYPEALVNLGNALRELGQLPEAAECFRQAAELSPQRADLHNNLGVILRDMGLLDDAITCYRRALQCDPRVAKVHADLGMALHEQGKLDEAVACYQAALQLQPDDMSILIQLIHQLQHLCLWDGILERSQKVIDAIGSENTSGLAHAVSPFSYLALPLPTTPAQKLHCARLKSATLHDQRLALPPRRSGKQKITLGYLSSDFRKHAVAYLIAEMFELHDRERFEVIAYSHGPDDGSDFRRRLVRAFDRFVDIRPLPFHQAAQRIAADGVDILIDLNGYTGMHRTQILALRPAPIQVSYLGFPATSGSTFMDYILVDEFIAPPDQQPFYTEKMVYLPCYQVNDRKREISPITPTRSECGLPAKGFVFCDFNNTYKITPRMFDVWMDLLKTVPGSVLWLLEYNRFAGANLRKEAAARGVAPERLVSAPQQPLSDHLARHKLADLFLDTFPYCAHTTASDVLWAGCPLLTLAGETFVSRVAGSVLHTIGLPELITTSFEDYKATALKLAQNPAMLADIRKHLAANRVTSSLFDSVKFTRNLELAYSVMWEKHAAGKRPVAFKIDNSV